MLTFDAVIRKLRVLLGGAYGKDKAVLMVQPILEKAEKAQEKKMTMPVFLEAVEYMMSDIAQRAKDYCTSSSPYPPEVGDWSEGFLMLWNAAILSSSLRGVIEGRLVPTLDPAWHSIEEEPAKSGGKGGGTEEKPQQQHLTKRQKKQQQQEQTQGQQQPWQQQWQPEGKGKGGGKGKGKGQQWDGYCGFSKEYTDANGQCNHMMCPFIFNFAICRDLHKGLEAHSGPQGRKATEQEYNEVKKKCQETWPNWKPSDTPPVPSRNKDRSKGGGKGKGKGKGRY
jgi:hypothetical protein